MLLFAAPVGHLHRSDDDVNTEGKVGGVDLQNNVAYHNAEGGVEKMTSDLAATFTSVQSSAAQRHLRLEFAPAHIMGVT